MKRLRSYHNDLINDLKDPKEAVAYLNAALEEEDPRAFLIALRNVAEAKGSISNLAKACQINRVSIYKMTSNNGNPTIDSILKLIRCIGLDFKVHEIDKKRFSRLVHVHS
jgi:probable addiction module antidote protein